MRRARYFIIVLAAIVLVTLLTSFSSDQDARLREREQAFISLANTVAGKLDRKALIGQLLMLHVPLETSDRFLQQMLPGSIFLDFRNIPGTKTRTGERVQYLRELKTRIDAVRRFYRRRDLPEPFFSIDQEGGLHKLLGKEVAFFPSFMALGEAADDNDLRNLVGAVGYFTCAHLREHGIQWNLSPVLDVQSNPQNPVIGIRSFGSDAGEVADLSKRYLSGLHTAGCIDSIKHFPGHGDTSRDSHIALPVVRKSRAQLDEVELAPFREVIEDKLAYAVMPAHIVYPGIDKLPATFSPYWQKQVLRKDWGFEGLIITDNLAMKAVSRFRKSEDYSRVGADALKAGADVLLLTSFVEQHGRQMYDGMKEVSIERLRISARRILYYKIKLGVLDEWLFRSSQTSAHWLYEQRNNIALVLENSVQRRADMREFEKHTQAAADLNRMMSRAGIRSLSKGKNYSKKELHALPLYSDIRPGDQAYKLLPQSARLYALETLATKPPTEGAVILHLHRHGFKKLLRQWLAGRGKGNLVLYTFENPFPHSSLGGLLRSGDSLVVTFSRSPLSKELLAEAYLKGEMGAKARVRYQP